MTDPSSSPRWWDFDEFSSAKPSDAQTVTRRARRAGRRRGSQAARAASPAVSPAATALSDATPSDEFLASLPDDMAEAEREVAGFATTPPADSQAVPPPPAAEDTADWVLPSMPGFAADLPTPPAGAGHVEDLPDAADWAAEADAMAEEAASSHAEAPIADWDIPAVPGLHNEPEAAPVFGETAFGEGDEVSFLDMATEEPAAGEATYGEAAFGEQVYDESGYGEQAYDESAYGESAYGEQAYDESGYGEQAYDESADNESAYSEQAYDEAGEYYEDEDENVEYIPGVWSEDGGSWAQEGQEDRWTGADGAGSVVTTDMPDWVYEGPSTADEGWDEYEAYSEAYGEGNYEEAAEHEATDEYEGAEYETATGDAAPSQARWQGHDQPAAVLPIPAPVTREMPTQEADQSWDAVADDDATNWDMPTQEDAASWDMPGDAEPVSWDTPAEDATGETPEWDAPEQGTEASWMVGEEDQPAAPLAQANEPISWEDINTWAEEAEHPEGNVEADPTGDTDWAATLPDPTDWAAGSETTEEAIADWATPEVETQPAGVDESAMPAWGMPIDDDATQAAPAESGAFESSSFESGAFETDAADASHDAGDDAGMFSQPDAFGAPADPSASFMPPAPEASPEAPAGDWQITDTESSWGTAEEAATPAWGAPEEDTTTSWTTGEADVTPVWGAEAAAESQWGELANEPQADDTQSLESQSFENQWDAPPPPPASGAMSFAEQHEDVLADPLSAEGDPTGFPSADTMPPPPPIGGAVPMAPEDLPDWMRPDEAEEDDFAAPLTEISEEEAVAEEIAAPFNPVIAGVEDNPLVAKVQDPGRITASIPEDQLPPAPEAAPVRPTWGQPGPSGIGPAPITSPTLSHPVPEGGDPNFAVPANKAGKQSSIKRILLAVLAALLVVGGAYGAWEFVIRDRFFGDGTGVTALMPGADSISFPADAENQVQWTVDVKKGEAFALEMETPAGIQVGFVAHNAEGQTIGAANTLEDGKNGYRFVAQNDVDGPITLTARASDSVTAELNMRIVPFAGTAKTADGVQWNVNVPADHSAIINVLTRGTNPNVVITTADGTEIGSSESFQSEDDEDMYNAQFKVPKQAGEQAIVITLKTDQAYDANSTLIVDLHN